MRYRNIEMHNISEMKYQYFRNNLSLQFENVMMSMQKQAISIIKEEKKNIKYSVAK